MVSSQSLLYVCQVAKKKPVVEERRLTQEEMLAEAAQTGKARSTLEYLFLMPLLLASGGIVFCSPRMGLRSHFASTLQLVALV